MNKHNGFVTCERCKCVTRQKKTKAYKAAAGTYEDRHYSSFNAERTAYCCLNGAKCDHQRKLKTERDRLVQAALRAREEREVDRQMSHEMRSYFGGVT